MEKLALVDRNHVMTDKTIERYEIVPKGYYRLVVHAVIFNKKHEMLIQHRVKTKKYWANLWDITCGGCVDFGEESYQGMERELEEELGLHYDLSNEVPLFTFSFYDERGDGFDDVYLIIDDVDITKLVLQKEEVDEVKWASLDEILNLLKQDKFITYKETYIKMLFDIWEDNIFRKDIYK